MSVSWKRLKQSLVEAKRGLVYTYKNEQNFRIQVVTGILVVIFSLVFPLRNWERIILYLLIAAVLGMELLNTALERLFDVMVPRMDYQVGVVKEVLAAAVLLVSIFAVIIGIYILWPQFANLFI